MRRGDIPPIKSEKDLEYYKRKYNLIFLADEIEHLLIEIWLFARIDRFEGASEIRDGRVKLYCKKYGFDLLETLDVIENIERGSRE